MRHERAQEEVDQEQADGHLASMSRQQFQHRLLFIHTKSASKMSWTRRKVMENVMEDLLFDLPGQPVGMQWTVTECQVTGEEIPFLTRSI